MRCSTAIRTVAFMTTTIDSTESIDEAAIGEFAERLIGVFTGSALSYMIDLGHRTGLFAAAAVGPATSQQLADRADLNERYVREWLGAVTTGGIFEYDADNKTYWLPREHAAVLVGEGPDNLAPVSYLTTMLGKNLVQVAEAFRTGGGVAYDKFLPDAHVAMDALWQPLYNNVLVPELLPLAPGVTEALRAGARVADVGCGAGNALLVLAAEFPNSTFVGYDIDPQGIARGAEAAAARRLTNLSFVECDAATLKFDEPFDVIFVFYSMHDQAEPLTVLERIHDALVPGGTFVMDEPSLSSNLEDNIGHPMAPFIYAVSTLHCMTVSLACGGAGLGTAWGEQTARQLLRDAGFGDVAVHDAPSDPGNSVFVTTRAR